MFGVPSKGCKQVLVTRVVYLEPALRKNSLSATVIPFNKEQHACVTQAKEDLKKMVLKKSYTVSSSYFISKL